MKKFSKTSKFLSLFLSVCMLMSLVPAAGFAADKTSIEAKMYNGASDLTLGLASDGTTRPTVIKVEGNYGKATSDKVYKVDVNPDKVTDYTYSTGYNHLNLEKTKTLDTTIAEFSFLNPGGVNFISEIGVYLSPVIAEKVDVTDETGETTSVSNVKKTTFFRITDNQMKLTVNADFFDDKSSGKVLCTVPEGEWVNVAIVVPGYNSYESKENYSNRTVYLYVNGVKYEIGLAFDFYGLRHVRFAPNANKGESKTFYYDNILSYFDTGAPFDEKEEAAPAVDFGELNVSGKVIYITGAMTVSQLEGAINTTANVRVYTDDTYTNLLSGSEVLPVGAKVVFGANNGRNHERAYSYYTVEQLEYDETGLYEGEAELELAADNLKVKPAVTPVSGNYGKAESDTVYKVDINPDKNAEAKYSTGYNFLALGKGRSTDTNVAEFSFLNPDDVNFAVAASVFTSTATTDDITITDESGEEVTVTNQLKATILKIEDGVIKTGSDTDAFASGYSSKELAEVKAGQWTSIAIVIPGYSSYESTENYDNKIIYVYINGVKNEIKLAKNFYGLRHLRFAPDAQKGASVTYYLDNIRSYLGKNENYDAKKDAQPVVDLGGINVLENTLMLDEGTTVSQLEGKISTAASIRVFEDDTYKTLLTGSDKVPVGAMVVFGASNGRTTERAYKYYTVGKTEYKEPNLYEGGLELTLGADNRSVKPTVTVADGNYGKSKADKVYKVDVNAELDSTAKYGTGYNFLSLDSSRTLETTVAEFSFLNPGDVNFSMEVSLFTSAATTDKINVTDQTGASSEVTNLHKGVLISIAGGELKIGNTANFLADGFSGKILGKAPAGQWTNVAVVIPGYNSYQNKENYTNKVIYVYVNGVKNEVTLAKNIYGVRHMRLAPDGDTGTSKTFYYDNIRKYKGSSERYDAKKDLKPVVDLSLVDVYEDNINVAKGTTVKEFKDKVSTNANIRVFSEADFKKQLEDTDKMGMGNIVVFATNNNRTTERAYTYYVVNKAVSANAVKLTNADGKIIRGTQTDIERMGKTYYFNTTVINKATSTTAKLTAIVATYEASGKISYLQAKPVEAGGGKTVISTEENPVAFEKVVTPEGGNLKAFLWVEADNSPLCDEFKTVFDGVEEYSVLAFGNSYSEDAFTYLPTVAKAAGIDIYAVNMYRGGCPLSTHLKHMNGDGVYQTRVEYLPDGTSVKTSDVSFTQGLNTPGYSWDYISLQSRSVETYDYDYFEPYLTPLADFIRQNSPASELLMHQTWTVDTYNAREKTQTKDLVADLEDAQIRPYLFGLLKQNYIAAAEQIGNPKRIVPVGEAVNYAIGTLGFAERVVDDEGNYDKYGRAMYRDATCHLGLPYGRVLAALTWYEYLTGHNAEENPYQNDSISAADMALLKKAAHWACSQPEYNK